MDNNIKVAIFDLGGVVVSPEVEKISEIMANYLGIDHGRLADFARKYKSDITKGKISLQFFYSKVIEHFGLKTDAKTVIDKHLEVFQGIIKKLDGEVLYLIEKLKNNYLVVCLANAESDVVPFVKKRGIYDYFERAYISTEMGMEKPDPEIYQAVLNDLNCRPEEAVFIDDKENNVDGARKLGINSIRFKDPGQLKKDLKSLGLVF